MNFLRRSYQFLANRKAYSSTNIQPCYKVTSNAIEINGISYEKDKWTNVTPNILNHLNRNLHLIPNHPLGLLRQNIINFIYRAYPNSAGNPIFSIHDRISPVVTTKQNFDSLLIPDDHVSRKPSDCYYINEKYILRGHTSAHQQELISMGLDNFIVFGDVYRRDEIDSSHYPVFHQAEGVRLFPKHKLFSDHPEAEGLSLFENGTRTATKQEYHTVDAVAKLENDLKTCLTRLVQHLFGNNVETRWTETFFPFTHPSFELEVKFQGKWLELLGCGIIEQQILHNAGVSESVGWAFGLGLERIAMRLYDIPDIRLFWSTDSGFLSQFEVAQPESRIKFKPVSQFPQCVNDISFWLPNPVNATDFYEIVREIGGDVVEQVRLVDEFVHPKTKKMSQSYRIVYRHMERTLTKAEVNVIHKKIEDEAVLKLGVTIR